MISVKELYCIDYIVSIILYRLYCIDYNVSRNYNTSSMFDNNVNRDNDILDVMIYIMVIFYDL